MSLDYNLSLNNNNFLEFIFHFFINGHAFCHLYVIAHQFCHCLSFEEEGCILPAARQEASCRITVLLGKDQKSTENGNIENYSLKLP